MIETDTDIRVIPGEISMRYTLTVQFERPVKDGSNVVLFSWPTGLEIGVTHDRKPIFGTYGEKYYHLYRPLGGQISGIYINGNTPNIWVVAPAQLGLDVEYPTLSTEYKFIKS